jgi:hypothetical protein
MTKKEAIRKFKEQKTPQGLFAVRCAVSNRVWVGSSRNLNSAQNMMWFSLRQGSYPERTLQDEWDAQGENAFRYEILETLDDSFSPMEITDLLKAKKLSWIATLGAQGL